MKVVIDTNVLVSAAIKDRGPERVIVFIAGHPEFEWVECRETRRLDSAKHWAPAGAALSYRGPEPQARKPGSPVAV